MKRFLLPYFTAAMCLAGSTVFSQTEKTDKAEKDVPELGLPGDNLDLYAVLEVFQKSKTIEAFEKTLNDEKEKINNLDLNLDKKVDFIKVVTKKDGESYTFILQVDVSKNEKQDVAIILLDRDKDKKISLQIVGDEELYGKDYVVEPKGNSSVTANPGYVGPDPVTKDVPASATTTVVVQSAPIVQYVYSPAYVPYYPPYYYGYYPPYFAFATVMAVGIYRHNHYHYHGGYHGGHYGGGNTVVINNRNSVNHYNNNSRNRSSTVSDNMSRGNYGNNRSGTGASASNRPSAGTSNRGAAGTSANRPSAGNSASTRPSAGNSASTRPSSGNSASTRPAAGNSASTRPSSGTSASSRPSSSYSGSSSRSTPSASSYSGGGGRSMSSGGGGMRSGGGGGGRRR
jgi:hypothetical protein